MAVLPDYLAPCLRVVICGTAVGHPSARAGHYYAGPGNEFWPLLYQSGILPTSLQPSQDAEAIRYGIGLTDLVKRRAATRDSELSRDDYDVPTFIRKLELFRPGWIAFHGKTSAKEASHWLGRGRLVQLGRQEWRLADLPVFVLPSASGSNRDSLRLEGKPNRLAWFQALADELAVSDRADKPARTLGSPGSAGLM